MGALISCQITKTRLEALRRVPGRRATSGITRATKRALVALKGHWRAFYGMLGSWIPGRNSPERIFSKLAHSEQVSGQFVASCAAGF